MSNDTPIPEELRGIYNLVKYGCAFVIEKPQNNNATEIAGK